MGCSFRLAARVVLYASKLIKADNSTVTVDNDINITDKIKVILSLIFINTLNIDINYIFYINIHL